MTRFQDCQILTGMALRGCDIANATVAMLVPVYEVVALAGCGNTPPPEAALLDLCARRSQTFALCNLNADSTFFRRLEANFWPRCRAYRHYGRTCASDRRLYAAMFNTNVWSTFFKPRTITWRMRPTVLAQPKPCSINLRFCCEMA